jgi:hypothetical protein
MQAQASEGRRSKKVYDRSHSIAKVMSSSPRWTARTMLVTKVLTCTLHRSIQQTEAAQAPVNEMPWSGRRELAFHYRNHSTLDGTMPNRRGLKAQGMTSSPDVAQIIRKRAKAPSTGKVLDTATHTTRADGPERVRPCKHVLQVRWKCYRINVFNTVSNFNEANPMPQACLCTRVHATARAKQPRCLPDMKLCLDRGQLPMTAATLAQCRQAARPAVSLGRFCLSSSNA